MSNSISKRLGGGFIPDLSERPVMHAVQQSNVAVPEVSYLDRIRVGNDQGNNGACSIFAISSWATVFFPGQRITDAARLAVYAEAYARTGRATDGLYAGEAFAACSRAGWLPGKRAIRQVSGLLYLSIQPMLAVYRIGDPWGNVSAQGCLDHAAPRPGTDAGLHMVVIAAAGHITDLPGRDWVYIENSWGLDWGWNGIGVMGHTLHQSMLHSLYIIE